MTVCLFVVVGLYPSSKNYTAAQMGAPKKPIKLEYYNTVICARLVVNYERRAGALPNRILDGIDDRLSAEVLLIF